MRSENLLNNYKFKYIFFIMFILLFSIYKILLPFGDEPDFFVRSMRYLYNNDNFISPYIFIDSLVDKLNIKSSCEFNSSSFTFLSGLNFKNCSQGFEQILYRVLIQIYLSIPIFIIIIRSLVRRNDECFNKKVDSFLLSILTPSYLYYFGVLGVESFMLLVSSLLLFFKDKNKWIMFLICFYVMAIDIGDSFVLLFFVLSYFSIEYSLKHKGLFFTKSIMLIILLLAFIFGTDLLSIFTHIGVVDDKLFSINSAYATGSSQNKYPVLLRPIITYMTLVFATAWSVKSVVAYIFVGGLLIYSSIKARKIYLDIDFYSALYTPIFVILFFVFMFPTYANAKYYVFMMPFFMFSLLYIHSRNNIVFCIILTNVIVIFSLFMSYLNWV